MAFVGGCVMRFRTNLRDPHWVTNSRVRATTDPAGPTGSRPCRRDETGEIVYEGVDGDSVDALMHELVTSLNLVLIHPFRDGNGRMARCLQTLVLAREGMVSPIFASIEEYLG